MKELDVFARMRERVAEVDLRTVLFDDELRDWKNMCGEERDRRLARLCAVPLGSEDFTVVYSLYFRLKWLDAFKRCLPGSGAVVLEVGSGSSTNIPDALNFFDPASVYITVNMNKQLTEGLRRNTARLPVTVKIIEDDANHIRRYLSPDTVDAIVFEHSVNDVLQAILCESRGMDTTNGDWFDMLPEMIRIISGEYRNKTLARSVKAAFLSLVENCLAVLKPGGCLVMSHYMYQYDLDLGYDNALWENIIPTVRPWLRELSVGGEIPAEGFDPQWWLFYRK
jgi:SAM-dependent methyltransferase